MARRRIQKAKLVFTMHIPQNPCGELARIVLKMKDDMHSTIKESSHSINSNNYSKWQRKRTLEMTNQIS